MKIFSAVFISVAMLINFSTLGFADIENNQRYHEMLGELVKLEGALVTVKDKDGKSHQFHVNKSTRTNGKVKIGSRVAVKSTDAGHALSVQSIP